MVMRCFHNLASKLYYNHSFATVRTGTKIYTLCSYLIVFFAPERSGPKNI
jgi:hypothetical protein